MAETPAKKLNTSLEHDYAYEQAILNKQFYPLNLELIHLVFGFLDKHVKHCEQMIEMANDQATQEKTTLLRSLETLLKVMNKLSLELAEENKYLSRDLKTIDDIKRSGGRPMQNEIKVRERRDLVVAIVNILVNERDHLHRLKTSIEGLNIEGIRTNWSEFKRLNGVEASTVEKLKAAYK